MNIEEIVNSIEHKPIGFEEIGEVMVGDSHVPRNMWRYVRPKPGTVVQLCVALSNSPTLRIVAAIAIVVAAAVAGPLGAGYLAGAGLFASGSTAFFAASAAISATVAIGGTLLLNALAPPPVNPASALAQGQTGSDIRSAGLTGNVVDPGGSAPYVAGYRRVFPPFISPPAIELIGIDEIVEGVYGIIGPAKIADIQLDGTPISQVPNITFEVTEGFINSPQQGLVTRQAKTRNPQLELSKHLTDATNQLRLRDQGTPEADLPSYHRLTTRDSPDEFWMTINFAQGFYRTDSAPISVPIRIRIRPTGSSDTSWVSLPEVHFGSNKTNVLQVTVKLMWKKAGAVLPTPPTFGTAGAVLAYKSVPAQTNTPADSGYDADDYFSAGVGNDLYQSTTVATTNVRNVYLFADRVEYYLDPDTFPKDHYDIEIIRGAYYRNSQFTTSTYVNNVPPGNGISNYFTYYIDSGGFASVTTDQGVVKDQMIITRTTDVWNEYPLTPGAPFALIAIKAKGRFIQQLSCMAGAYVPLYNGTDWTTLIDISTNPAEHYRNVLTSRLGAFPKEDDEIDDASIVAWRQSCIDNNYTINAVIQGSKQTDVMNMITSAGKARPLQCETWGVTEDHDRSAEDPIQIFTPRTMADFQWQKTFSPFTDGFRVKFDDSSNNYIEDQIVVLDPEAMTSGARLEDIRYETLVTQNDAIARALFDLKQARRRLTFYSGTVGLDVLKCRRGDLVGVAHDMLASDVGFGRINTVTTSAGNVTAITIDGSVPAPTMDFFNNPTLTFFNDPTLTLFEKPTRMGVMIRCSDGTFLVKEVTAPVPGDDTMTLNFVTPFTNTGIVTADALVTIGPLTKELLRLVVQSIVTKDEFTATITMVDEANDLFTTDFVPEDSSRWLTALDRTSRLANMGKTLFLENMG
jgi:hypothetical protein